VSRPARDNSPRHPGSYADRLGDMRPPHDVLLPRSAPPNNAAGTPTPPSGVAAIRATGLRKQFRSTDGATVVAVDDVDLTVQPGEIVAFLGPNGAGKTPTVDMLLGLTSPDAGAIEVYGTTPAEAVRLGRVSAVMQTGGPSHRAGRTS